MNIRFSFYYIYIVIICMILLTACSSHQFKPLEKESDMKHADRYTTSRTVTLPKGAEIKEKLNDFDSKSKSIHDEEIELFLQDFFDLFNDGRMDELTSDYLDSTMHSIHIAFIADLMKNRSAQIQFNSIQSMVENEEDRSKLLSISTNMQLSQPKENVSDQIFYLLLVKHDNGYRIKEFYYPDREEMLALLKELEDKYEEAQSSEDTITIFKPEDDHSTGKLEIDKSRDDSMTSVKSIVQNNDHKVFQIIASNDEYEVTGSGFFIRKGIIATNFHVIVDMTEGFILLTDGSTYEIEGIIAGDPQYDLAILKLKKEVGDPVHIGDPYAVEKGDEVVAIGSPLGIINTVSVGIISNIWTFDDVNQFQISVPIDHGSSGGALFNMDGQVIGMTTAGIAESGADLNFAISIEYVDMFLDYYAEDSFNNIESISLKELFGN